MKSTIAADWKLSGGTVRKRKSYFSVFDSSVLVAAYDTCENETRFEILFFYEITYTNQGFSF